MYRAATLGLAAIAILSSCATVEHVPAEPIEIRSTALFNAAYEDVWDAAVDWFATRNIEIGKLDKASGYINSEYYLRGNAEILECGSAVLHNNAFEQARAGFRDYMVKLNFTVRRERETATRVNVNLAGGAFMFATGARTPDFEFVECISKGKLESAIFSFVGASVAESGDSAVPDPKPFEKLPRSKDQGGVPVEI